MNVKDLPNKTAESTNDSSFVSLEELYSSREILKKAKLPTNDIDEKIKELENEYFFDILLPELARVVPQALSKMTERVSFSVFYTPNKDISVLWGTRCKTIDLSVPGIAQSDFVVTSKESEKSEICNPATSNDSGLSEDNIKDSIKNSVTKEKSPETTDDVGRESSGVWIEPYKDGLIIVKGDTEPFLSMFMSYGGRVIKHPTEGWQGWIFMQNREDELRKVLSSYLITPTYEDSSATDLIKAIAKSEDYKGKINSPLILKYVNQLSSLKDIKFLGITGPHKAIMLIAILKGIRSSLFKDNRIYFIPELEELYNTYWSRYVGGKPILGAVYPFVHLGQESFFSHKVIRPFKDFDQTWNHHSLERHIAYAVMDQKLVDLVNQRPVYDIFVKVLREKYCFNNTRKDPNSILSDDKSSILTDDNHDAENIMEMFKEYALQTPAKHGKPYSKQSVQVYVRALVSDPMNEIVSRVYPCGNIYDIRDLETLSTIKRKVEEASVGDRTLATCKAALNLYMKFFETLKSND